MKALKKVIGPLFAVVALMGTHVVQAQFPGAAFFREPSVAIPEGGQGTLELQAFGGSATFGATHLNTAL